MRRVSRWTPAVIALALWTGRGLYGATPQYEVVFLDVDGYAQTQATGISNGQITGFSTDDVKGSQALLWPAVGTHATPLSPLGSRAWATDGTRQAGNGPVGGATHALLWAGTPDYVDLNPAGRAVSRALGTAGQQQVGFTSISNGGLGRAAVWNGSAETFADLHPAGTSGDSLALATDGLRQGGRVDVNSPGLGTAVHAYLWEGSAASGVDVNPPWARGSSIQAMIPGKQGGGAEGHAAVWYGTAESAVSFRPTNLPEYFESTITGMGGNYEVGWGTSNPSLRHHALLWHDVPESAVDLHAFLPAGYLSSEALAVDERGVAVGWATAGTNAAQAVMWIPIPEPTGFPLGLSPLIGLARFKRARSV